VTALTGRILDRLDHTAEDLTDTCACGTRLDDEGRCAWCDPADGVQFVPDHVRRHYGGRP